MQICSTTDVCPHWFGWADHVTLSKRVYNCVEMPRWTVCGIPRIPLEFIWSSYTCWILRMGRRLFSAILGCELKGADLRTSGFTICPIAWGCAVPEDIKFPQNDSKLCFSAHSRTICECMLLVGVELAIMTHRARQSYLWYILALILILLTACTRANMYIWNSI